MTFVWQNLTHDNIFKTVEETLGIKLSNICLKRNSYINRVYELEEHDSRDRFIVKFYRPGRWSTAQILEEHQFLKDLHDKEIPVIAPLLVNNKTLFMFGPIPYSLFPKKGGRAVNEFDQEGWLALGRTIARIHLIGEIKKRSQRLAWTPAIATKHHLGILTESDFLLPDFKRSFAQVCELFIKKAEPKFNQADLFLIHGDLHKGNLLLRPGEGLYIVDFDDCCVGPAVQDLWLLLPDTLENSENELSWFLSGYELFRSFNRGSLDLAPALQAMRIIHYAAWLAIQCQEPDFANHFPHAGTARYWNQLIKDLQEIVYEKLY
ncbi:MAG: serine/threonine protein kinase [Candidatus Margulisbacteria bacterium]|nr:serine/threonine protein kinase [Candidatus Margulisiibacteriota bacterium]